MKNEEDDALENENQKLALEIKNLELIKKQKKQKIEKSKAYFQKLLTQYNNITNSLKSNQPQIEKNTKIKNSPTQINKFSNFDFPSLRNESNVISSLNSNISNVIYEYSKISNNINESKLVDLEKEENYDNVYLKRFLKKKKIGGFDKKKNTKKNFEQNQNYLKNSLLTKIKEKVDSEYI